MKADLNDAPLRMQGRNTHRPLLLALFSVAGIFVLGIFAAQFMQETVSTLAAKSTSSPVNAGAGRQETPQKPLYTPPEDTEEDIYLEQVNRMLGITSEAATGRTAIKQTVETPAGERQTVFTDANYTPDTSINTISMPRPDTQRLSNPPQRQQPYVTVVKETRISCGPFKEGSVECRKHKANLHQHYRRQCDAGGNSQSHACRQANRYDLR